VQGSVFFLCVFYSLSDTNFCLSRGNSLYNAVMYSWLIPLFLVSSGIRTCDKCSFRVIPAGDPDELLATRNGESYCDGVFEKLVTIGQTIPRTAVFTLRRVSHLGSRRAKKRRLYTRLYASIEEDPEYCTEECFCVKIGEIVRHPPRGGWPDVVTSRIEIRFGETEMAVRIFEEQSKVEYRARIDFL